MADKRISQLIERTNIANNDVLPIVASGATTTNKVTVSTLQDWMQDNLDVGVTSVGITIGSTGTDVNVTGSPVTSSGNITINIPTASATNRGLLSSADWTTFNNKVSSVGLSMPSAFSVANSPITGSGTIAVTGAGTVSQYIRGDGSLADFPQGGGGGSSVNYYLNGSVSQGTIGGIAYQEINKTPVLGAGTDFTIAADGYIASFITDAGDPALLEIPAGNWNFETYLQASSGGGTPSFYIELYKVNSGGTATLIASNSATPELIAFGTTTTPYFSALAVPTTSLTLTDRLALRYYVTHSGRTITLHTENATLCQIITTFTTGLTALNGLTAQVQNFATGTSGTDFAISSSVSTHTFNLPTASATNRGALSSADWTTFNNKQNALTNPVTGTGAAGRVAYWDGSGSITSDSLFQWNDTFNRLGIGKTPSVSLDVDGAGLFSSSVTASSLIRSGGTSSQFLKADGSVDSSSYALNSSLSLYLPLTGGTISGQLNVGSGNLRIAAEGASNITILRNFTGTAQGQSGFNNIGFNNSNNFYFTKNLNNGAIFAFTNTAYQTYTLQDASGTLAFTSQIPANPVGGTGTANIIPKFTGGSTLGDSSLQNVSNSISNLNPPSGQFAWQLNGNATTGQSFGALVVAGTNASDIAFAVRNTGGVTTLFEVQGDGNVGIGTNSPDVTGFGWKTLTIKGGTASGEAGVLELQSPATTGAANLGIIAFLDGSNRNAQISGVRDGANNSGALSFVTWNAGTGAERLRIASTGAATFSSTVQINQTASEVQQIINSSSISNPAVTQYRVNNSSGWETGMSNAADGYKYLFSYGTFGIANAKVAITSVGKTQITADTSDYALTVVNAASNAYGMYMIYTGYSPNSTNFEFIYCADSTQSKFIVWSNGSVINRTGSYGAISDAKVKENIEDATPKLDDLMKVKVRNYNLIGDDKKQIGVIAQELEEVFPAMIDESEDFEEVEVPQLDEEGNEIINEEGEVVTTKERVSKGTTTKSVKYSVFVPMLIKAIQEQQEQIQELKTEIDSLKNQMQ